MLEYGSAVWSNFIDKSTFAAVDNFQGEYFRKALGIPKKTSHDAMLCDIAILRQSLRFERERSKLKMNVDLNLCPPIVQKQIQNYQAGSQKVTKYFYGQSKQEVVDLRDDFTKQYPSCVLVPKKESFDQFVTSLKSKSDSTDSGYRLVYTNNSNTNPWRASLSIRKYQSFPVIPEFRREPIQKYTRDCQEICRKENYPVLKIFRRRMCPTLTELYQHIQWGDFSNSSGCDMLRRHRGGWYHDPLLHELKDPFMRVIRKCRLGRSELAIHSFYHEPKGDKNCTFCNQRKIESLNHFFFKCPRYSKERSLYFEKVKPLFRKLGLPQDHVSSCLGFNQRLGSKKYRIQTKSLRTSLYKHTCDFLRQSNRFRFV